MNSLQLENFKAFFSHTTIDFEGKNALIYGENGSGKSSIYEALRLWFYTEEIYNDRVDETLTDPSDIQNAKDEILASYNHQLRKTKRFSLSLDGRVYRGTTFTSGINACFVSREDIEFVDELNVSEILRKTFVGIYDTDEFIKKNRQEFEKLINTTINEDFSEPNIRVSFYSSNDKWLLNIEDTRRGLTRNRELTRYFNEGKLHIVLLIFLLSAALLNGRKGSKKLLVVDDVFTSLDAANRTFFTKYLYDYFRDWQKIVMTHSVSLFNQMEYSFCRVGGERESWKLFKILALENDAKVFDVNREPTSRELRRSFNKVGASASLSNDVRKRFEYLVGEISSCLSIGSASECARILSEINRRKPLYYRFDASSGKLLTAYDLIAEIKGIVDRAEASPLKHSLDQVLHSYRSSSELDILHGILQSLMVYQKVTMHSGSHATGALPPFTQSEMDRAISLLQELEKLMDNLFRRDMYSI